MPAVHRILVAVKALDGKPLPAVLKAAQLARAYGAQLELFHALATPVYADPVLTSAQGMVSLEHELRQNALRRLESIADRLRVHSIKVTVSADWDYPAHEAVVRRAQVIKADLIVASLHSGRHRLPWLLRLTDWELVRQSPIPLLLVKNPRPYRHPAVLVAIDPARAYEKPLQLDKEILRIGRTLTTALREPCMRCMPIRASSWPLRPRRLRRGPWRRCRRMRDARRNWASIALCGPRGSRVRANTSSVASPSMPSPRPHARATAPSS